MLTISMDQDRAQSMIVNSMGQIVWSGEIFNNKNIDVSEFASGSYILLVKTKEGVAPTQLVIMK